MNEEKETSLSSKRKLLRENNHRLWRDEIFDRIEEQDNEAVLRLKEKLIRNEYICIGDINEIFGEELAQHSYSSGTVKNPAEFCHCGKFLGFRGFCSKKCHDEFYDSPVFSDVSSTENGTEHPPIKCNHCGGEMQYKKSEGILIPVGDEDEDKDSTEKKQ